MIEIFALVAIIKCKKNIYYCMVFNKYLYI